MRAGTYYALLSDINVYAFGVTSPVTAYVSQGTPLGPWVRHDVVTRSVAGHPGLGQQSFVMQLNRTTWLWGGDRWGSAPVIDSRRWGGTTNNSGLKSADFYSWVPMVLDGGGAPAQGGNTSIEPVRWVDSWQLDLSSVGVG